MVEVEVEALPKTQIDWEKLSTTLTSTHSKKKNANFLLSRRPSKSTLPKTCVVLYHCVD